MKKSSRILLLLFLFFNSCSLPNYIFDNKAQTTGLDFTNGKWLINDIDCSGDVYGQLTKMAKEDFGKYLDGRLFYTYEVKGIILPKKNGINPTKNTLKEIKIGSNFDFFINIKARNVKEEIGGIDTTPHRFKKAKKNQSEVTIEVYDLNLAEIIYSQKVIGITQRENDNDGVHFSKTSRNLTPNTSQPHRHPAPWTSRREPYLP